MSRKQLVPSYRLPKAFGQARVIVDGKHIYLGLTARPRAAPLSDNRCFIEDRGKTSPLTE